MRPGPCCAGAQSGCLSSWKVWRPLAVLRLLFSRLFFPDDLRVMADGDVPTTGGNDPAGGGSSGSGTDALQALTNSLVASMEASLSGFLDRLDTRLGTTARPPGPASAGGATTPTGGDPSAAGGGTTPTTSVVTTPTMRVIPGKCTLAPLLRQPQNDNSGPGPSLYSLGRYTHHAKLQPAPRYYTHHPHRYSNLPSYNGSLNLTVKIGCWWVWLQCSAGPR